MASGLTAVPLELDIPWEAAVTPEGHVLYTEICRGLSVYTADGQSARLLGDSADGLAPDFFCDYPAGMTGLVLDPDFGVEGSPHVRDVYVSVLSNLNTERSNTRVVRLTLAPIITDPPVRRVDIMEGILYKAADIPYNEDNFALQFISGSGQMSSCRLRFGLSGTEYENILFVTSGDNHNSTLPGDMWGLGAKVFAIDRDGNPFSGNTVGPPMGDARVFAHHFRNPQGLAMRPGTDQIFISEHGPGHSDEVTMLANGGNGGWDPTPRDSLDPCDVDNGEYCGYDGDAESMPMTDFEKFADALPPVWDYDGRSAGMSPCAFLEGSQWGAYEGWLAVGIMGPIEGVAFPGDQSIVFLQISDSGEFMSVRYNQEYLPAGRYRSVQMAPSGNLLVVETNLPDTQLPDVRPNIREYSPEDFGIASSDVSFQSNEHSNAAGFVASIAVGVFAAAAILFAVVVGAARRRRSATFQNSTPLVQDVSSSATEVESFEMMSSSEPIAEDYKKQGQEGPKGKNRGYDILASV